MGKHGARVRFCRRFVENAGQGMSRGILEFAGDVLHSEATCGLMRV